MSKKRKKTFRDINQDITNKIIAYIEENNCLPWSSGRSMIAFAAGKNHITKNQYRGINFVNMSFAHNFACNEWLTYKQAKALGGNIRKGEKSSQVVFYKMNKKKELVVNVRTGKLEESFYPMLIVHPVFNIFQCEGVDYPELETFDHDPIKAAEKIVSGYLNKPVIDHHIGNSPCYIPFIDQIKMPEMCVYKTSERYYKTLFHELIHSTGHQDRLNRQLSNDKESKGYSKEELIAELGAAFLCAQAGITNDNDDNSAAYIKSWLKALKDDKKFIVQAAQRAQKAVDHINQYVWTESKEDSKEELQAV